jgi:DnaJ-class molecular chaperone
VRFLILSLIALAGCIATLPSDASISADLACELARSVVQLRAAPEVPDDKPKPGDKCENCDGRGYVGDGTVKVKCQPCDGTGKVQ